MKKKNLLFICGAGYVSGAEIATLTVMEGLQERGFTVACLMNKRNDGDFIRRLAKNNIPFYTFTLGLIFLSRPLWTIDTLIHYPKAVANFKKACRHFKPDGVFHCGYRSLLMLYPFLKGPQYLHVHDCHPENFMFKLIFRLISSRIQTFIAVSNFVKENLIKIGVPAEKISVVHNGIPFHEFNLLSDTNLPVVSSPITIGIVGQVVKRKGHETLIDALYLLKTEGENFQCLIYGKGDEIFMQYLKEKIDLYGLQNHIQWMGFFQEKEKIYTSLDLVIVPTLADEPFGLVAVEPAFWGIPVIASRTGGLTEILLHQSTGLFFEAGNKEDLAQAIRFMMDNPNDRILMGRQGKLYVGTHFTSDKMCGEIENILIN